MRWLTWSALLWVNAALAASFPLEWSARNDVGVPCEVEFLPAKLGLGLDAGYRIVATTSFGETPLETAVSDGFAADSKALRFTVPKGTTSLRAETVAGANRPIGEADNLLAGVLGGVDGWTLPTGVSCEPCAGGLRFSSRVEWPVFATRAVRLPENLAGTPAVLEFDVANRSELVWGGRVRVVQLDEAKNPLPETVADPRWTDHMRPVGRVVEYRCAGRFHMAARWIRLEIELVTIKSRFDAYGRPLPDPKKACTPVLEVTRAVVRPAARLPFPKWRDDCFADGVSGETGDSALRLGGADRHALYYQSVSRGGWTDRVQFRREEDRFFPAGDGTVEAWFHPDWSRLRESERNRDVTLFQAYRAEQKSPRAGEKFALAYVPAAKRLSFRLCDWAGNTYTGCVECASLPDGRWTHVAVQWSCRGTAEIYLDGRAVFSMPIPKFEAVPISDSRHKEPNDLWATEFYLGGTCPALRLSCDFENLALYEGSVDDLRVSSGCRYAGSFVPLKDFACDGQTRALFKFDRAFDGVSGGGFGFVPASFHAKRDRVEHQVEVADAVGGEKRNVQYFPADLCCERDPRIALNTRNYVELPTAADYLRARERRHEAFAVRPGDKMRVKCGPRVFMDYVEISNAHGTEPLRYPIVVNNGRLDPRSFGDLRDSLGLDTLADRDRCNRIFQYMLSASDYFMNHQADFAPGSDEPRQGCYEAMLMLNSYCGFECGPLNNMTANMFATVGDCPSSMTLGYGHLFEQVLHGGKNHIYDLSAQMFFPAMDNETDAHLGEAADQPGIFKRLGKSPDHFIRRGTRGRCAMNPGYREKTSMTLNPGETLRVWWANDGTMNNIMTWGRTGVPYRIFSEHESDYAAVCRADDRKMEVRRKDRVFPQYSTGIVRFDGRPRPDNPAFELVESGSFCYHVKSCYPIVWGDYAAYRADGSTVELDISTDFKTFAPLPTGADGVANLEYLVKARHDYLIRARAPISDVVRFCAATKLEVNTRTYPGWLEGGDNELLYKADGHGEARVSFAWREEAPREIVVRGGAYHGAIPGFERQLVVVDPSVPSTLAVDGIGPDAEANAFGAIEATLVDGRLSLRADPARAQLLGRGDDRPGKTDGKSYFAGVEIRDGGAVKYLTVLVSPDSRLVTASEMEAEGARLVRADGHSCQDRLVFSNGLARIAVPFAALPAGRYGVYALVRFPECADNGVDGLQLVDPLSPKSVDVLAKPINGNLDYLKATYGRAGEKGRWKWDTNTRLPGQNSYSGWRMRTWAFPSTGKLELRSARNLKDEIELAAVMILPEPELEFANEIRHVLFGLNCDPLTVR